MAMPFCVAGVVVSLALTRSPFPVGRVYGVDLAGAALGCLGALLLLNRTDGPTAVLWVSVMLALAAYLFTRARIGTRAGRYRPCMWLLSRSHLVLLVLLGGLIGNALSPYRLRPLFVKGQWEAPALFEAWNSFSRVAVFRHPSSAPHMWGPSPYFRAAQWPIEQRHLNIDGDAGTVSYRLDGDIAQAAFLQYDVTHFAYFLPQRQRAAIIGVGGGRDMLAARVFGIPQITGVEINPIFIDLLTREPGFADYAALHRLDGMTFEVDEARSWFARTEQTFDVIQMSLIDTWAATGAGAFTLSENGLYTVEAWRIFLSRLTPDGVFTVSRWYAPGAVNETGRMISLAMATAFEMGLAEPQRHLMLVSSGSIATLVLSRTPLSSSHLDILEQAAKTMGYRILASPRTAPASDVLRRILACGNREELDRYTGRLALDLTPSTDERPFFFNQLPLYHPLQTARLALATLRTGVTSGNLLATATLLTLFLLSSVAVAATIVIPLRPALPEIGRTLASAGTAYFFLIGIGFMSTEIGLVQRLSVFLGHPIYALSIVLFSLILTTGVGSLLSDRLPLDTGLKFAVWAVVLGGYLFGLPFWLPTVALEYDGAILIVRALVCVAVITPAGTLMGYGFPTGMRLISAIDSGPTPWFWGINGAASVLASTLAVACSMAFGINTTLVIGAMCYWGLIGAACLIGFREGAATVAGDVQIS
jgi:spermidine synthase